MASCDSHSQAQVSETDTEELIEEVEKEKSRVNEEKIRLPPLCLPPCPSIDGTDTLCGSAASQRSVDTVSVLAAQSYNEKNNQLVWIETRPSDAEEKRTASMSATEPLQQEDTPRLLERVKAIVTPQITVPAGISTTKNDTLRFNTKLAKDVRILEKNTGEQAARHWIQAHFPSEERMELDRGISQTKSKKNIVSPSSYGVLKSHSAPNSPSKSVTFAKKLSTAKPAIVAVTKPNNSERFQNYSKTNEEFYMNQTTGEVAEKECNQRPSLHQLKRPDLAFPMNFADDFGGNLLHFEDLEESISSIHIATPLSSIVGPTKRQGDSGMESASSARVKKSTFGTDAVAKTDLEVKLLSESTDRDAGDSILDDLSDANDVSVAFSDKYEMPKTTITKPKWISPQSDDVRIKSKKKPDLVLNDGKEKKETDLIIPKLNFKQELRNEESKSMLSQTKEDKAQFLSKTKRKTESTEQDNVNCSSACSTNSASNFSFDSKHFLTSTRVPTLDGLNRLTPVKPKIQVDKIQNEVIKQTNKQSCTNSEGQSYLMNFTTDFNSPEASIQSTQREALPIPRQSKQLELDNDPETKDFSGSQLGENISIHSYSKKHDLITPVERDILISTNTDQQATQVTEMEKMRECLQHIMKMSEHNGADTTPRENLPSENGSEIQPHYVTEIFPEITLQNVIGESKYDLLTYPSLPAQRSQKINGGLDAGQLVEALEKEAYKRKHCIDQIQDLQEKLLEAQQQLAVAVSVDRKKDGMIDQLDKTLKRLVDGWKRQEAQRQRTIFESEQQKNLAEKHLTDERQRSRESKAEYEKIEGQLKLQLQLMNQKEIERAQDIERLKIENMQMKREVESEKKKNLILCSERDAALLELERKKKENNEGAREKEEMQKQFEENLKRERDEFQLMEHNLSQEMQNVINQLERKLEEEQRTTEKNYEELEKNGKEVAILEMDLDSALRTKESLKVELNIQRAKHEANLKRIKSETAIEYEKKIEEQTKEFKLRFMEDEKRKQDEHKKQLQQITQIAASEQSEMQKIFEKELEKMKENLKSSKDQLERQVEEANKFIGKLIEEKKLMEKSRNDMVEKMQVLMQSHCSETLMLLGDGKVPRSQGMLDFDMADKGDRLVSTKPHSHTDENDKDTRLFKSLLSKNSENHDIRSPRVTCQSDQFYTTSITNDLSQDVALDLSCLSLRKDDGLNLPNHDKKQTNENTFCILQNELHQKELKHFIKLLLNRSPGTPNEDLSESPRQKEISIDMISPVKKPTTSEAPCDQINNVQQPRTVVSSKNATTPVDLETARLISSYTPGSGQVKLKSESQKHQKSLTSEKDVSNSFSATADEVIKYLKDMGSKPLMSRENVISPEFVKQHFSLPPKKEEKDVKKIRKTVVFAKGTSAISKDGKVNTKPWK